jgi:hypothetical protein
MRPWKERADEKLERTVKRDGMGEHRAVVYRTDNAPAAVIAKPHQNKIS